MATQSPDVDRGWAWVVAAAAACSFFILGGYLKGFGIFFAAFLDEFEAPVSVVSVILGVRSIMYGLTAPIATSLCDRVTERVMILIAGLLHLISNVASSQARSIEVLIFANGVIGGLAAGTTFGPVQVAIAKYFRKRKSLAMSLVFCGATLGQIVMSPVIVRMFEFYGLRGTLLLYGGLMLNLCVTGMLARPITRTYANQGKEQNVDVTSPEVGVASKDAVNGVEAQAVNSRGTTKTNLLAEDSGSTSLEMTHIKSLDTASAEQSHSHEPQGDRPTKSRDHGNIVCRNCGKIVAIFLDFSLCKSPRFVLFVVCCILTSVPYFNLVVFIFPRGIQMGLSPESTALLLTINGVCELVGRFAMGILADIKKLGPLRLYIILTAVTGGMGIALTFCKTFTSMAVLCAFLGLCGSAPVVLPMSILVDIVTVPRLAKGLGFLAFFQGVINTVAPSALGLLKDTTGSYDTVFLVCGTLMIVGSLVMVIAPVTRRCCHDEGQAVTVTP